MVTKEKISLYTKKIIELLRDKPDGLRKGDLYDYFAEKSQNQKLPASLQQEKPPYNYETASRPTVDAATRKGIKEQLIDYDPVSRKFKITATGTKYIEKFMIADVILSSNYWDSYFIGSPLNPASATYPLVQADNNENGHGMALLLLRLKKQQSLGWSSWLMDILDYAVETKMLDEEGLLLLAKLKAGEETEKDVSQFLEKLREVWGTMFKGVKRAAIVQFIDPEMMLERVMAELTQK